MESKPQSRRGSASERKGTPMDIAIRFYDNFSRTMDSLRKSLEAIQAKYKEQDAVVNFGVGHVEDKKLTHGISQGAVNYGVYAVVDIIYNPNVKEYIALSRYGDILRFSWSGNPLPAPLRLPTKTFNRFLYVKHASLYVCWTTGKSSFFVMKDDFSLVIDTVAIAPINNIIYGGRKNEETFDIFIICGASLNKYSYHPGNNVVTLQDALKLSDIEAEGAVIEHTCFDNPPEGQTDRKQWIYATFKRHCSVVDSATGRIHLTKKNLHDTQLTAILATGASEFIVTGDVTGMLRLWGNRLSYITEIHPHSAPVSHLIEHPNGRAAVSFSRDLIIFAWSFDSKQKLETLVSPEEVEKIAINNETKSFLTQGPRKLVIWKMNVLYHPHTHLSAPLVDVHLSWHPDFERRAYVLTKDNSIRIINPSTGQILTSIIVNPPKPLLFSMTYVRNTEMNSMFVLAENTQQQLEVQRFDCTLNPAKLMEAWDESVWETAVTCFDLYDCVPSVLLAEKHLSFSKKHEKAAEKETFLIVGRRDGCVSRVHVTTGEMDYFATCHKGAVVKIEVNNEMNQFVSLGDSPSLRLWKIALNQDDIFIPLFDISWKLPIKHVALVREIIGFTLSTADSPTHRVVLYNTEKTARYDHRVHHSHNKEIISFSSSKELVLFCSASLDETVRIWSDENHLVRLISLNWVPSCAKFGSVQGDIFVGILNQLQVIPAETYLTTVYRNRVMMGGYSAGSKEAVVPLNVAKTGQDARMYVVTEEHKPSEPLPAVQFYKEPADSQVAKEYELLRLRQLDLQLIVEGKHPLDVSSIPDPTTMTKKQWDELGKSMWDDEDDEGKKIDRKFFISEARKALLEKMDANKKDLNSFANIEP